MGLSFYPRGGLGDCEGVFDSIEVAKQWAQDHPARKIELQRRCDKDFDSLTPAEHETLLYYEFDSDRWAEIVRIDADGLTPASKWNTRDGEWS